MLITGLHEHSKSNSYTIAFNLDSSIENVLYHTIYTWPWHNQLTTGPQKVNTYIQMTKY